MRHTYVSPIGDVTLVRTLFGSGINKLLSSATENTHTLRFSLVVGMFSLFIDVHVVVAVFFFVFFFGVSAPLLSDI